MEQLQTSPTLLLGPVVWEETPGSSWVMLGVQVIVIEQKKGVHLGLSSQSNFRLLLQAVFFPQSLSRSSSSIMGSESFQLILKSKLLRRYRRQAYCRLTGTSTFLLRGWGLNQPFGGRVSDTLPAKHRHAFFEATKKKIHCMRTLSPQGSLYYQPKRCTFVREFHQNYHTYICIA